ncbi:MAG TPA: alpha-ketoacid dehydrogenase subunit beta [Acidimicrobiales bacterium]|nr:alpha-ketoacid dehydrogenase subunit beta [Acidimicrobiales bacterium]
MTDTLTAQRTISYVAAFIEAVKLEMEADPTVFIAGEDVGAHGGVFHTFDGVQAQFGERRAVDTPISEQAIIGLGIGAAVTGLRPIVDLMFMDFTLVAADQLANQAAKLKYMFGGEAKLPLTITTTGGAGLSAAAQHSQSLEALFCHIPGIKVVYPSDAYDVKGLMAASVREDNPTLFVLHKKMLGQKGVVPEERYEIPLGHAAVKRAGNDVTVVSWGKTANDCLAAAESLAGDGIDCEVVDLRTLSPLDIDTVVGSVRKTNRVIVAHEAVRFGGFGAEVAAEIQEYAFDYLDAPVGRVAAPYSPVPFTPALESRYVPDAARIAAGIRDALARPLLGA